MSPCTKPTACNSHSNALPATHATPCNGHFIIRSTIACGMSRWSWVWPWFVLVGVSVSATAQTTGFQRGFGVHRISIRVQDADSTHGASIAGGSWRQNVSFAVEHTDAQFLVFRFAHMNLPPGASLVIRDGSQYVSYKRDRPALQYTRDSVNNRRKKFFTKPLHSRRAVVEYTAPPSSTVAHAEDGEQYGFHIDEYRFAAEGMFRGDVRRKKLQFMHRLLSNDENKRSHHDRSSMRKQLDTETVDADQEAEATEEDIQQEGIQEEVQCVSGEDESDRAACVKDNPPVFQKTSATARLLVHKPNGSIFCTGFLLGCEGHILTNNHCVSNNEEANSTFVEFLAQGQQCSDNCDQPMGCPGVIEVGSSEIVASSISDDLDFTLLKPRLPDADRANLATKYGFLSLRTKGASKHERIFIPQHPAGYGKRVALKHDSSYGNVVTLTDVGCNLRLHSLGYKLDTQGGSSGSPVIAFADKTVVGLHYCGGCLNSAIPSDKIVATLQALSALPKCAAA